jgi:protoporphyrinogen/coproporphyrinogen III oxidase
VVTGGRRVPLPAGLLGIPAGSDDIARLLGAAAAAEALRRDGAPVRSEAPPTLGALVRDRLGDHVAESLVDPVIAGVHATRADDAELLSVAPSLYPAMVAHGGLMPAVGALRGALGPAGSPVASLTGGMGRLVARLHERLVEGGARIRTGTPVVSIRVGQVWSVATAEGELLADVLCLAVPAPVAGRLLTGAGPGSYDELSRPLRALPTTHDVTLVTLLVEDAVLTRAGAPVGSGVLIADGPVHAKAMTHASVKWAWLADALPADHHVVRLSYGGTSDVGQLAAGDAALVALAVTDLRILLDGALGAASVRDALVTRWSGALSRPVVGRAQLIADIDAQLAALPQLAVVGSAVAGNGLAGVVGRSRLEAARTL